LSALETQPLLVPALISKAPEGAVEAVSPLGVILQRTVLAFHLLGQPVLDAEIASPMLSWACWPWNGVLVVYGDKTTESQSARRTNGRRRLFAGIPYALFFQSVGNEVNCASL
jgi:hypothetical protein